MTEFLNSKAGFCLLVSALITFSVGQGLGGSAAECGFNLISSDERRIVLQFHLPAWELEAVELDGASFSIIRTTCGEDMLRAGYPVLPQFKALIAVPPGCRIKSSWNQENIRLMKVSPLIPAQPAGRAEDDASEKFAPVTEYNKEFNIYLIDFCKTKRKYERTLRKVEFLN